jgi:hypothetical protein
VNVAIVGAEGAKFTPKAALVAKTLIRRILAPPDAVLVSGHCHLGGIDIWAEEIAKALGRKMIIHIPTVLSWREGFKPRNLLIVRDAEVLHNITVSCYPPAWKSMRFSVCYHCKTNAHVKSGGCWTARKMLAEQRPAYWHIIANGR